MKIVIIILVCYLFIRFLGKLLVELLGKLMILWVCEFFLRVVGKDNVYVVIESSKIKDVVELSGFRCVVILDNCFIGIDRVVEVVRFINVDNIINV